MKRYFSKEDIQMTKRHMKRCKSSLSIREIKIPMRFHLTLAQRAIIKIKKKKSTNNNCWKGCGENRTLLYCWWGCKLIKPLWRTVWGFLNNNNKAKNNTTIWSSSPTTGHILWENHNSERHMYSMFTVALLSGVQIFRKKEFRVYTLLRYSHRFTIRN